jgi:hypothetical protein
VEIPKRNAKTYNMHLYAISYFFFFIDDCQLFEGSTSLFVEKRGPTS